MRETKLIRMDEPPLQLVGIAELSSQSPLRPFLLALQLLISLDRKRSVVRLEVSGLPSERAMSPPTCHATGGADQYPWQRSRQYDSWALEFRGVAP
jgi:hypothetical protein